MVKPLENIRVLDLSRFMAGPFCGKILADLGAEVIKVEPPWGDELRYTPPFVNRVSPMFADLNRGKKGVTINLKTERGVEIFKELARRSDVLIENYSVGTMSKLGIGYETLRGINPGLIYVAITGFGQYGPRSRRHSFDMIGQATSGFMYLNGKEASAKVDAEIPPILMPDAMGDSIPGVYAAISVLAALNYRGITGRGQMIDIAQQDTLMYNSLSLVLYKATGVTFLESMSKYPVGVYNTFKARDGNVAVAAPNGATVDSLNELLGVDRVDDDDVREWIRDKTMDEAMALLTAQDIPATPIFDLDMVYEDPQARAREMMVDVEHPEAGTMSLTGIPMKFSDSPLKIESHSPLIGQDNEEILKELLGLSQEDIDELREKVVI
jgi:CoA:oxalate CoA-transferase